MRKIQVATLLVTASRAVHQRRDKGPTEQGDRPYEPGTWQTENFVPHFVSNTKLVNVNKPAVCPTAGATVCAAAHF